MRTCPACGEELSYESEFCPGCGAETDFYMKPAGFWIRVGAYLLDVLIFLPLGILTIVNESIIKSLSVAILLLVPHLIYKPVMEACFGATLGKMICKIRVLDDDGNKLSVPRAYVRFLPLLLSYAVEIVRKIIQFTIMDFSEVTTGEQLGKLLLENPGILMVWFSACAVTLFVFIDCLFIAFNPRKRAIHDMMAGSFCVKKPSAEQLQAARDMSSPEGSQPGQQ